MSDVAKVGRPLKYTPEELDQSFEDYKLLMIQEKRPFTKSGFNVYLGVDKNYLSELPSQFSGTYKRITHEIENHIEEGLLQNKYNATGAIFNLKNNYGWTDRTDINQKTEHSGSVVFDSKKFGEMSKQEIEQFIKDKLK